jgi:hypothetical protein
MQENIREREKTMHGLKKDNTPLWKEAGFIITSSGRIWDFTGQHPQRWRESGLMEVGKSY